MPPCDAVYMVDILFEIGPSMPGFNGKVPITQSEISSWQSNSGIKLSYWESRTIRQISIDYVNECHAALSWYCEAPWPTPDYERAVRARYSAALKENLRSLANNP